MLVTLGTVAPTLPSFASTLDEVLASLRDMDVDVVVTVGPGADVDPAHLHGPRVRVLEFAPLAELLPGADLVVSAAGVGSLLAALTTGRPQVLLPLVAEQPYNAGRAAATGAAVIARAPSQVGAAVRTVLDDPSFAAHARAAATRIAGMAPPDVALRRLHEEVPRTEA